MKWAGTLLVAAVALMIAATPAGAQEPSASLPDIEDEVMCPICGTALNLSESPQAERERAFIRRRIAEGLTKDEIKDALVVEYGSEVLAIPDTEGFDLVAWVVPGLAIVIAGGALLVGVRRWRREGGGPGEPGGPDENDAEANDRLDADLEVYGR